MIWLLHHRKNPVIQHNKLVLNHKKLFNQQFSLHKIHLKNVAFKYLTVISISGLRTGTGPWNSWYRAEEKRLDFFPLYL